MPADWIPTLAWVSVAALLAPIVSALLPRRLLPIIVAEILLGIVAGQSGLRLIEPNPVLAVLGWLGFAMLMFVSGIEIDLKVLLPHGRAVRSGPRRPLSWSMAIVLATFLISVAGAFLIFGAERPLSHVVFLALVLSTTSVGIVVPTLKERGIAAGAFGQILLAGSILADLLTMLLVSVLAAWMSGGESARAWLPLAFLMLAAIAGVVIHRFARKGSMRDYMQRLDTPTGRMPLRSALALLFVFALAAEQLGAELVLAAFLAGVVVGALVPRGAPVLTQLEALGFGFLIPMFFFGVGVGFDLPALLSSRETLLALPALILLAYANKVLAVLPLRRFFPWREVLGGGMLLSARLSLIIAAAAIGMRLGVLDSALNSAMILLAIFTSLVSPVLFNLLAPAAAQSAPRARRPR
jgi:Kef-type K+ transport system membrane component KefB